MQDDLFYATITVREHLLFQAKLRMGKTCTHAQYTMRVDTVLEELGLVKCRDTFIGGTLLRGISGGERKRLSFATEILTNPSLLFVDEPTSGLDSYMAETVVLQLQQLAQEGRTVVVTIHQPPSELFTLFDTLYLLADGATCTTARPRRPSTTLRRWLSVPGLCEPVRLFHAAARRARQGKRRGRRMQLLKDEWAASKKSDRVGVYNANHTLADDTARSTDDAFDDTRLGPLGQMVVLMHRNFVRLVRDRILDLDQKGIQNFAGAFFVIIVNQTFASASPLFVAIPTELPMILREYRAGLYRLVVWFIAKNVSELPVQILMPIVFFLPIYFLIGIGHGVATYLALQLLVVLLNFATVGLGYMVSCIARRVEIAPIVGIITLLPFMLFGGLFLNSDDAPKYFIWIQYVSPIKYGFEGFMKVFWNKIDALPCDAGKPCLATSGTGVLGYYSIDSFGVSAVGDALVLLALGLGFRLVGLFALWWNVRAPRQ